MFFLKVAVQGACTDVKVLGNNLLVGLKADFVLI